MAIRTKQINILTDGAGAFSVTVTAPGLIRAIGLDVGTLSTPDIDVTDAITGESALSVDGVAADAVWHPKVLAKSPAGVALDVEGLVAYESPAILRTATIALTGAGNGTTGVLYLFLEN